MQEKRKKKEKKAYTDFPAFFFFFFCFIANTQCTWHRQLTRDSGRHFEMQMVHIKYALRLILLTFST